MLASNQYRCRVWDVCLASEFTQHIFQSYACWFFYFKTPSNYFNITLSKSTWMQRIFQTGVQFAPDIFNLGWCCIIQHSIRLIVIYDLSKVLIWFATYETSTASCSLGSLEDMPHTRVQQFIGWTSQWSMWRIQWIYSFTETSIIFVTSNQFDCDVPKTSRTILANQEKRLWGENSPMIFHNSLALLSRLEVFMTRKRSVPTGSLIHPDIGQKSQLRARQDSLEIACLGNITLPPSTHRIDMKQKVPGCNLHTVKIYGEISIVKVCRLRQLTLSDSQWQEKTSQPDLHV